MDMFCYKISNEYSVHNINTFSVTLLKSSIPMSA